MCNFIVCDDDVAMTMQGGALLIKCITWQKWPNQPLGGIAQKLRNIEKM